MLPACLVAVAAVACHQIAGIEDREFVGESSSALCDEYCETVMEACRGENAVYTGLETCLGVCAKLPPGDRLEPRSENSVACRLREARLALEIEPGNHCRYAGPGGHERCGDNCEAYCSLLEQSCANEFGEMEDCAQICGGMRDRGRIDVDTDHEGNTVQCRLVHVSSATVLPETHCRHSRAYPTEWCIDELEASPTCADYCAFTAAVCADERAVYESPEQCEAVCAELSPGTFADTVENTVGCRYYHTNSSLLAPDAHCAHTGPGGDGHCGEDDPDTGKTGSCESYCKLLQAACGSEFSNAYTSQDDCHTQCSELPPSFGVEKDQGYTVATAKGATLACRLLNVSRALLDPEACAAAMGGGECE
jgi:hypothetical protein